MLSNQLVTLRQSLSSTCAPEGLRAGDQLASISVHHATTAEQGSGLIQSARVHFSLETQEMEAWTDHWIQMVTAEAYGYTSELLQAWSLFLADAAATSATAFAVAGKKAVIEGLIQTEALGRVILQHLLYEVEQLLVVLALRHHVMLKRFAVFPDISPTRAVNIPVQLRPVDITLFLGFLHEVCRNGSQDPLHHSKVLFTVMSLEQR